MSSGSHDSLADALRGMSGEPSPKPAASSRRPSEPEPIYEAEYEPEIDGEVDDESGEIVAAAPQAFEPTYTRPSRSSSASRPTARRKNKNTGLKQAGAPVLITVGALLLIPAVWSLLLLTGATVSDRSDAKSMALIMLVCWPIALSLIGGGIWFLVQVKNEKRK